MKSNLIETENSVKIETIGANPESSVKLLKYAHKLYAINEDSEMLEQAHKMVFCPPLAIYQNLAEYQTEKESSKSFQKHLENIEDENLKLSTLEDAEKAIRTAARAFQIAKLEAAHSSRKTENGYFIDDKLYRSLKNARKFIDQAMQKIAGY